MRYKRKQKWAHETLKAIGKKSRGRKGERDRGRERKEERTTANEREEERWRESEIENK